MEMNFCRRCGTPLSSADGHVFMCTNGHELFYNCAPSTGVFIINAEGKLLLSVRGIEPHKGMLDAFGGFVDGEESIENALQRELREELGIDPSDYSAPEFLTSAVGHYPYASEIMPVLSSFFWVKLKPGVVLTPQDDVADIAIFDPMDVDYDKLHDDDIVAGIQALQARLSA